MRMMPGCTTSGSGRRATLWRRGFTFVEIMFSVMILGIGLVMVAAMLLAGGRETQSSADETIAAATGRDALKYIGTLATEQFLPRTLPPLLAPFEDFVFNAPAEPSVRPGWVMSFHDPRLSGVALPAHDSDGNALPPPACAQRDLMWSMVAGNLIMPSDPRYAWVPFYRRDRVYDQIFPDSPKDQLSEDDGVVEIIMLIVRCGRGAYDQHDLTHVDDTTPATLEPALLSASFTRGNPCTVQFTFSNPADAGRLASDAFVIMSDDGGDGSLNGRIFRLGNPVDSPGSTSPPTQWELAPGAEMSITDPAAVSNAKVFVLGRGYADPTNPAAGFAGPAQDVAVYTAFVPVRP
jgi:prepilin-type N-terminal cleavage/methylation domain-containing protein